MPPFFVFFVILKSEVAIMNHLDEALEELSDEEIQEYEEVIELWIMYGGD